jgi:hypothetical protein
MRRSTLRALIVATLTIQLSACVYDEIAISVRIDDGRPYFDFRYVRRPGVPVQVGRIVVEEKELGRIVWDIGTYDPSMFYEKKDGKVSLKPYDRDAHDQIRSLPLSTIGLGQSIPGFRQYYPAEGTSPELEKGRRYVVRAVADATGKTEFTLLGECRKVSITSFSKDVQEFRLVNDC